MEDSRSPSSLLASALFTEHRDLTYVFWRRLPPPMSTPNNGQNHKRGKGTARHKDPLRIGSEIRRVDQIAFGQVLRQIVRHHAFDNFIVFELQSDPQAFRPGARRKRLTIQGF